jgi:hypothetical protein
MSPGIEVDGTGSEKLRDDRCHHNKLQALLVQNYWCPIKNEVS